MGKRITYFPYDRFLLRAPMLPLGILSSVPTEPSQLYEWLEQKWKDPCIREGLILGSLELSRQLAALFTRPIDPAPDYRLLLSFLRYITRFSSRCTPFGTFAGFLSGRISDITQIDLSESSEFRLYARPDMEFLMNIRRLVESKPEVRELLSYSANTTLYSVGSGWHFVEVRMTGSPQKKAYDIVKVDDNGVIGPILEFCREGRKLAEIRGKLIADGWNESDVFDFVDQLIENQVLVSNLEPVICGPEYHDCLLLEFQRMNFSDDITDAMIRLKSLFSTIRQPGSLESIQPSLDTILRKMPVLVNHDHLVQVDMELTAEKATIGEPIVSQVLLGLRILRALSSRHRNEPLKYFKDAFVRRYGDRKVKLTNVLDAETGIGLDGFDAGYWACPAEWIEDLRWEPEQEILVSQDESNNWLVKKYHDAILLQQQYITLVSVDLQEIGLHDGTFPLHMMAMFELFRTECADNEQIHLLQGSSGNPAYLMGRFASSDPGKTGYWIRELMADEQADSPMEQFAEVVHLPEDRTGNILQRPSFLAYEIPYLARSAKPADQQIPVTDLLVSVEGSRIVLTSATTGKIIRPRMTNAYNHHLNHLPVFKFLHRIQLQDIEAPYQPAWGAIVRNAPFIPGIRFKNILLASPTWLVRCKEIQQWIHPERNGVEMSHLFVWKTQRQMPDEMVLEMEDQELYFSWTNANLVLSLWEVIRKFHAIRVRPFQLSGGTPVKNSNGFYANQFVVCFKKTGQGA